MKQTLKQISVVILIVLLVENLNAQSKEENFEVLMPKDGLSHSVITTVFQDSRGFMWFGTPKGLNFYDGFDFHVFEANDSSVSSISGNYIRAIYEDSKGNIWVGTEENGLNLYNKEQFTFESFNTESNLKLCSNKVLAILEDFDRNLWVGTDKGLCIFNKETKEFANPAIADKLIDKSIKCIVEDKAENLWIGTNSGMFYISRDRKNIKEFLYVEGDNSTISNNEIHCIYQDKEGNLLIGTNGGLNLCDSENMEIERISEDASGKIDLSKSEIYSIVEDKTGNLWFGTFGSGLVKWDNKNGETTVYTINPLYQNSISNDFILSLLIDKSGLLWIGTYGGGINKLNLVKISFGVLQKDETISESLISEEIYSIFEDKNRNLWIGTDNGISILNKIEGRYYNIVADEKKNGLRSNSVYCFAQDEEGNIWVGTNLGGLHRISPSKISKKEFVFESYTVENSDGSLLSNDILSLFVDQKGKLWIGTANGLNTFNYKFGDWGNFTSNPDNGTSLPSNIVQTIFQDKEGTIWIGTDYGLAKYNNLEQTFSSYLHKLEDSLSLPNNNVYSIEEDEDGLLWVGTDAGLSCLDENNNTFTTFNAQNGLPDNVVYGILTGDDNNLWISTNNGLSKFVHGSSLDNYFFVNYNSTNWLHCNSFNIGAYYKNRDGILYFGCNEGITYFHPEDIKGNLFVPPVFLTKFQLFYEDVNISNDGSTPLSKHITATNEITLKHYQDILYFEFTALNYIQNEKNNFAFMLENFNDEWVYLKDNERSATFTNLDPGEYVFKIKAANNNGIWNEYPYKLKITIKPPFWKTWWFYIACVVGCILSFYLYVHIRTNKLRVQRKILEEKVKERTEEVLTQKEELQAALDNLKRTQTQLVDKEKMASLGQLTAGVAHEINNPINFVSGNVAPLDRDVKDILEILAKYESTVELNKLNEKFIEVDKLKEELDYDFLKGEINDLIRGIKEGAHRTSEIVKSLRSFSRLDENDLKQANINHGIESTLLILRNKLKNRIEVIKEFDDLPEIFCFPGKLNQVFMNILTNAAQAIIGEGKIYVKTKYKDGNIVIEIKDTGVGMPEDVRKKVFDPFFTTKDVGDGTGLGLSISFGIIETHNGTITVESAPGEGTEFVITLPERNNI